MSKRALMMNKDYARAKSGTDIDQPMSRSGTFNIDGDTSPNRPRSKHLTANSGGQDDDLCTEDQYRRSGALLRDTTSLNDSQ